LGGGSTNGRTNKDKKDKGEIIGVQRKYFRTKGWSKTKRTVAKIYAFKESRVVNNTKPKKSQQTACELIFYASNVCWSTKVRAGSLKQKL